MSETAEGIGSRKWSFLGKDEDTDQMMEECGGFPYVLMEGKYPLAALTKFGDQVKLLFVTAPQLWEASNDVVKITREVLKTEPDTPARAEEEFDRSARVHEAILRLGILVAKAVGKTNWKDVAQ